MVAIDQYNISPEIIKVSKHHIEFDQIDSDARTIIQRLNKAGFKGYIVGGFVRDSIKWTSSISNFLYSRQLYCDFVGFISYFPVLRSSGRNFSGIQSVLLSSSLAMQ